jgi:sulfide:quinone oxidoreductase
MGEAFRAAYSEMRKPVLAYCLSGTHSTTLWALAEANHRPLPDILARSKAAGYDLSGVARRIANGGKTPTERPDLTHEIVIVGGGAAGVAVAASLLKRQPDLDIAVIEPADVHYYQPGWTLVGCGVFSPEATVRTTASVLPRGVRWIQGAVTAFEPRNNAVILGGCRVVGYKRLIVCPGIKLDWHGVKGLPETLGRNGVTSNYRFDLAPYTWRLVQELKKGRALFTMPPAPIKCAGAPQKAMYMSADHWRRTGCLKNIDVAYHTASGVLFGGADYVPALMEYVKRYSAALNFNQNLVAIDGAAKKAWFESKGADGKVSLIETPFDMIHVCPPQTAPDFIRVSPLADQAGWLNVDHGTLRHKEFDNIYGLGDVTCTPNAKTVAAARKQAPVVAENVLCDMRGNGKTIYDGYGACPLTVERGKIVFAEFQYGGKLAPTFPKFLIDGPRPSRLAWYLKERVLPPVYWLAMLKGREWLVKPKVTG